MAVFPPVWVTFAINYSDHPFKEILESFLWNKLYIRGAFLKAHATDIAGQSGVLRDGETLVGDGRVLEFVETKKIID